MAPRPPWLPPLLRQGDLVLATTSSRRTQRGIEGAAVGPPRYSTPVTRCARSVAPSPRGIRSVASGCASPQCHARHTPIRRTRSIRPFSRTGSGFHTVTELLAHAGTTRARRAAGRHFVMLRDWSHGRGCLSDPGLITGDVPGGNEGELAFRRCIGGLSRAAQRIRAVRQSGRRQWRSRLPNQVPRPAGASRSDSPTLRPRATGGQANCGTARPARLGLAIHLSAPLRLQLGDAGRVRGRPPAHCFRYRCCTRRRRPRGGPLSPRGSRADRPATS